MSRVKSQNMRDKLSQWESHLAVLTEGQKESYMSLTSLASSRPMPNSVTGKGSPKPETEGASTSSVQTDLEDPQQVLSWFDTMDAETLAEQEKSYRAYSQQLSEYRSECGSMIEEVRKAREFLQEMHSRHQIVSTKTSTLHQACQQLVGEQEKLVEVAESISGKLSYFTELERISSRVNALSLGSPDAPTSLLTILPRLDECILFIEKNPQYKDSALYLARFKQHLSRALGVIKQSVISTLKSVTNEVRSKQEGPGEALVEASYAQFYGKFRSKAPAIKEMMKEIEARASQVAEYRTLLQDCHQCYVSQRGLLLSPTVTTTIQSLHKTHGTDHCALVRSSCNFMSRVCQDEYQLFYHFFSSESHQLNALLESLCYSLYDALRPVVIHTNHLETLADYCTILKIEMLEERVEPKGKELEVFGRVVKQMLEDVQQRLIFMAQLYVKRDIQGYKPAPGDLAYPDKLIVASSISSHDDNSSQTALSDSDSVFDTSGNESDVSSQTASSRKKKKRQYSRQTSGAAVDMHDMWYPTVRRTLLCLSKLSRCIEKQVFEGVAHEALAECVHSLEAASLAIKAKKLPRDAQLFQIKHLLILREQISAFDNNFSVTEVSLDWTRTKAAAYGLLQKKSRLFSMSSNNAFLEFFVEGSPEIIQTHSDSRKDIDMQLKKSCERFISDAISLLTEPIKGLLSKLQVIFQLATKDNLDPKTLLHRQPFAAADELHRVMVEQQKVLKTQVPLVLQSLSLYLANEETEHILFRPCRASVLQSYEEVESVAGEYYSSEDQYIIACPTQEQVSLMLSNLVVPKK